MADVQRALVPQLDLAELARDSCLIGPTARPKLLTSCPTLHHPHHRRYNSFQAAERHDFEPRQAAQGGTGGLEKT